MGASKRLPLSPAERELIERSFPSLADGSYEPISEKSCAYNCIAWAAGNNSRWWWPLPVEDYYWPAGIPRMVEKDTFIAAFKAMGYQECGDNFDLEPGYEKVALYLDQNEIPTHMARQLPSGAWTSKLGNLWDILHYSLSSVEGDTYGTVAVALRRPIR